jgi:YfiH family protein
MNAEAHPEWIVPDWPAPRRVRALVTTRSGGVSTGPYASLNLGAGVGDDPEHVARNRSILGRCLPAEPVWLRQVHSATVVDAARAAAETEADGAATREEDVVCAVLTADCLPVLLCDREGGTVGVAHAGWRGLARGILESTIRAMRVPPNRLLAYIGPGIGAQAYEVGEDVRDAFVRTSPGAAAAFSAKQNGKFFADLYFLARSRLAAAGVTEVCGGGFCTSGEKRFFSFRRDGITGRMASLIWLEKG